MSDDLAKFIFLCVMIFVTIFANRGVLAQNNDGTASFLPTMNPISKTDPVFVLPQIENAVASASAVEAQRQPAVPLATLAPVAVRTSSASAPPGIHARVAYIADLYTGKTYLDAHGEDRWPIASISKLMTTSLVLQGVNMAATTTLAAVDFRPDDDSTVKTFRPGETYSARDLLYAALLPSSNEAAMALSRLYPSADFAGAMNARAVALGMADTHFDEPTGLSSSNQSTASDLRKLALNIYEQYPEIFKITRMDSATITELNTGKPFTLKNINEFAGRPDFLGGKTGYTDQARGNLLSIFSFKGRPVVIVVMGTDDRFGDTGRLLGWLDGNFK